MGNEFEATLIERAKRTADVESFRFIPDEKVNFIPGQFTRVLFDAKNKANRDLNKYLSFSASPTKEYIEVTKRLSDSAFSQRLRSLALGEIITFKAPTGNCVFKEEYKKIGFLIGGIGITPVISIIEYIVDKNLNTNVKLFYSNRTEENIAFKNELDTLSAANKNIEITYLIVECQPRDKNCIFGEINRDFLATKMQDSTERIFYLIGPPKMVEAMKAVCLGIGCSQEKIRTENFTGY